MTKQKDDILLTVFTPAYNRAHTLPRVFASLVSQPCKSFVWLIVDDGSTDDTAALVREWQRRDNGFEIRYVYKENGGMHTAHNAAYAVIDTELCVCIDSDDAMSEDGVGKILRKWAQIRDGGYAGIIGLDADFSGNVIGKGFPKGMTETTLSAYYAAGGRGDKKLVYRTDVINAYPPYPVIPGEKYMALAWKYLLIDQDWKLAVLDEVLCCVEYQADGSTHTMLRQYIRNPQGFALWRRLRMQYPSGNRRLFLDAAHYVSSSIFAGNRRFLQESPRKAVTLAAIPLGVVLNLYVRVKGRE